MFMNMKRAKLTAWGMAICFLLIHVLMISIFIQCGVTPMAKFNVFSIVFYIFMLFVVYKEWLQLYAVAVYLEVAAHMVLAALLTGWGSGFQITLIGMNVLAFFAEYTGRTLKLKYIRMMPMCILGMIFYLSVYVYLHFNPAPYALPEKAEFWLSILWGVIVFVINLFVLQFLVIIANKSEEQLEYQLSHDKLTGLPNRYYLTNHLDTLQNGKEDYWIAISDIDDFKKVNDTYGHNCGDYVLKTVGEILSDRGALCCRWGGEEFLFVAKTSEIPNAYEFLEKIRKEIEKQDFDYEGVPFKVTMTFGVSASEGKRVHDIIHDADEKLYLGKHSGKNRVITSRYSVENPILEIQDPLTRVKNKVAFEKTEESLNLDIQHGAANFGIVLISLKNVDEINKKHGQDKGDEYILGSCKLICGVYINSQVYRIKPTEFVVVITGSDYYARGELMADLSDAFKRSTDSSDNNPWHRYEASIGMAVYNENSKDVSEVLNRARSRF
ncbi:diguanylate cyclase (GGDEF) domain-containing protein [Butyrivibrio sp. ob235]|uniref:GGDEF domain-containing protein n=2 Tax=unclassified Butyrivibrio TaxID=2639466 RepID=UPI0003B546CD|nr:diguanylate cyclase [Butyrivibrio sp. ob235]SEL43419.1 diguanylate cyclase (GGDEF) domain-containing protein [Butyrivibrio sp. ob235]